MNELLAFLKKFKVHITFAGLMIVSLLLINVNSNAGLDNFRSFVIVTVAKIQKVMPVTLNPTESRNINQELRELNLQLYSDVVQMKNAAKEYDKLKQMIDFKDNERLESFVARVVGKSTVETRAYLTLDKGSDAGVRRGMPVRTDAGLVGLITGTTANYSVCEPITNKHVATAVITQRTDCQGILKWEGGNKFSVNYISTLFDVQTGDIVLTSNMSNKFPPEIPVGQISKVEEDKTGDFYKITLTPYADFDRAEYVFVVNSLPNPERVQLIEEIEENLKNRN